MNIHEYQGKAVLKEFGAPVSRGHAAFTVEEAEAAARQLPGPLYVVKSQIHAGGRGKGTFKELPAGSRGGVRLAKSIEEVKAHAAEAVHIRDRIPVGDAIHIAAAVEPQGGGHHQRVRFCAAEARMLRQRRYRGEAERRGLRRADARRRGAVAPALVHALRQIGAGL